MKACCFGEGYAAYYILLYELDRDRDNGQIIWRNYGDLFIGSKGLMQYCEALNLCKGFAENNGVVLLEAITDFPGDNLPFEESDLL